MKPLKLEEISTLIKEQIKKYEKVIAVSYTHLTLPTTSRV